MQVRRLLGIGVLLACANVPARTADPQPKVEVVVRTADAGGVRLSVSLINEGTPCRAVWVTPRLLREQSGPMTVAIGVRAESGGNVKVGEGIEVVRQTVNAADMYLLDCGSVLGQIIDFKGPLTEWPFDLKTGKYEVRACITSRLTDFMRANESWGQSFRDSKLTSTIRRSAVRDFASCSAWTELSVQ
jgi:hypothetical protein